MTRPEPLSWSPETMTKAEHREEALRLMGQARRPHPIGKRPYGDQAVLHMFTAAQLHLALSTDPLTPDERTEPVDHETHEYKAGWNAAVNMQLLHDRIPGFAIVRPRNTDPFEANKAVLAEYGITTAAQMWDVLSYPHADPRAHPTKITRTTIPAPDDALPTTSDGTPAGD